MSESTDHTVASMHDYYVGPHGDSYLSSAKRRMPDELGPVGAPLRKFASGRRL